MRCLRGAQPRREELAAAVAWNGKRWYADNEFQTQLTALISAFDAGIIAAGDAVTVRTKDNTNEMLGLADLKALAGAVMQYVQGVYAQSWAEKDAL
jgi:hypothetical protein